jgi:regulator of protease activity HflC (stomatin/prohibitin superfamily)
MKLEYKTGLTIIACIILSSCSKVPAGYKGVKVNLYGSEKGISEQPLDVGKYYIGWNEELYLFPTFLQNYTWISEKSQDESITMQTSEGLSINTDVGITYNIRPENVVKVFQKYRQGIDEITNTFLRNMVRDAMNQVSSTMTVEQIYGLNKEDFIKKVNIIVKSQAVQNGIEVDKIYLIGSFRLPETVIQSINSKIQASQNAMKVENEVATAKAEAQKTVVQAQARAQQILINAESQAKANKILADSLTPEFVHYQTILRWNGILPTMMGSNAIPLINLQGK